MTGGPRGRGVVRRPRAHPPRPAFPPPGSPSFNHTRFHYSFPLTAHPNDVFEGESGCSPHSPTSFVAVRDMLVPALETGGPAIRAWRAVPTGEGETANVTYFDLTSGAVVVGQAAHNWTTALTTYTYTVLGANAVDRTRHVDALRAIKRTVDALVAGQATTNGAGEKTGYTCNKPVPALADAARYLGAALDAASGDAATGMEGGLRPAEAWSEGGCIVETAANYEGEVLTADGPVAKTPSADACCKLCR